MTGVRIGLILPYWTFWEASAGGAGFRDERRQLIDVTSDMLRSAGYEIAWSGLISSVSEGAAAATEIRQARVEVLVVVQTMAVPPAYMMEIIDGLADLPAVVWALQPIESLPSKYDEADITSVGATVGTPMLTNVLGRRGRPYALVVGTRLRIEDDLFDVLLAAAASSRVRHGRLLRVGMPLDGYECVEVEDDALSGAIGIEVLRMEPSELASRYLAVSPSSVDSLYRELEARFDIDERLRTALVRRALALASALEQIDRELAITAGAMNSHVRELRFADDPGITLGYALGHETTRGVPWTDVGDALTPIAMAVGKIVGGATLYHEIEAIDPASGEVIIANSGEHDLAWNREADRPRLIPNSWYESDPNTGPCVRFELPAGPATVIAFVPSLAEPTGFRFVAAEGEITGRHLPNNPTVGGAFAFTGPEPGVKAWTRWVEAGVNHHSSLSPGFLARRVELVARFLGVGFIQIS